MLSILENNLRIQRDTDTFQEGSDINRIKLSTNNCKVLRRNFSPTPPGCINKHGKKNRSNKETECKLKKRIMLLEKII